MVDFDAVLIITLHPTLFVNSVCYWLFHFVMHIAQSVL